METKRVKDNGSISIAMAGLSGQGLIMYTRVLATAFVDTDYTVRTYEVLGTAHRGTLIFSHIRISKRPNISYIIAPGEADLLVSFEPLEALRVGAYYLKEGGQAIINTRKIIPVYASIGKDFFSDKPRPKGYLSLEEVIAYFKGIDCGVISFNATEIAQKVGHFALMNIVMLGATLATGKIPTSLDKVEGVINRLAPKGTAEMNIKALLKGMEAYQEISSKRPVVD
jgi:indolepyruvate ferredoxin oxidoreductase beta subunit